MLLKTSTLKTLLTLRGWMCVGGVCGSSLVSFCLSRDVIDFVFYKCPVSIRNVSLSLSVSCSFGHGASRPPVSCSVGAATGHLHLHQPGSSAPAAIRRCCRRRGGWRTHRVSDLCRHVTGQDEDLRGHIHQPPKVRSSSPLYTHTHSVYCSVTLRNRKDRVTADGWMDVHPVTLMVSVLHSKTWLISARSHLIL